MAVRFHPLPASIFEEHQRPFIKRLNGELRDLFALEGVILNPRTTKRSDLSIARREEVQVDVTRISGQAGAPSSILDADTLDGLDSTQFLRSDVSDAYTSGTLSFNAATTMNVAGTFQLSGSAVTSTAAELNKLDGTGATVTAANLTTLTDTSDSDGLHSHSTLGGIDVSNFLRSDESDTGVGTYTLSANAPLILSHRTPNNTFGDGNATSVDVSWFGNSPGINNFTISNDQATKTAIQIRTDGTDDTAVSIGAYELAGAGTFTIFADTGKLVLNATEVNLPDGVPLVLEMADGTEAIQTTSQTLVSNLNANYLDGRDSTGYLWSDTDGTNSGLQYVFSNAAPVFFSAAGSTLQYGSAAGASSLTFDGNSGAAGTASSVIFNNAANAGTGVITLAITDTTTTFTGNKQTTLSGTGGLTLQSVTSGDLTLTSASGEIVASDDIHFPNSIGLVLGAGDDDTIEHDGTNLLITPAASVKIPTSTPLILNATSPTISWDAGNATAGTLTFSRDAVPNPFASNSTFVFTSDINTGDFRFVVSKIGATTITSANSCTFQTSAGTFNFTAATNLNFACGGTININPALADRDTIINVLGGAALTIDGGDNTVQTHGGRIANTTRITGATTLDTTHHIVFADTDGGAFTVTLPAGVEGTNYKVINVGSSGNNLTIDPDGSEQVLGSGAGVAVDIADGDILDLHYNATEGWW